MHPQKLDEVFTDWTTNGGIFNYLQSLAVPWKSVNIAQSLDLDFYGNIAGERVISPLVRKIKTDTALSSSERALLAKTAYDVYGAKWAREYAVLSATYDPLNAYDIEEIMTDDERVTAYGKTRTRTDNLSHTKTGTETATPDITEMRTDDLETSKTGTETRTIEAEDVRTDDLTETRTGTETRKIDREETQTPSLTQTTNVYGFNSAAAVPAGNQVSSGSQTTVNDDTDALTLNTTEKHTGTQTDVKDDTDTLTLNRIDTQSGTVTTERTGTETTTYNTTESDTGTQTDRDGGTDTTTRNYSLTRTGTTGQSRAKLIEEERGAWMWDYFRAVVYPDLIQLLTCPVY